MFFGQIKGLKFPRLKSSLYGSLVKRFICDIFLAKSREEPFGLQNQILKAWKFFI